MIAMYPKLSIISKAVLVVGIFISTGTANLIGNANAAELPPVVENISLPDNFSMCGEPFPLEDRHVREMLDREFTISVWDRAQVFMWLKRAGRFFPHIESELSRAGLPDDLKYLAVAESALIPYIRSRAGAVGLWQFMPGTGQKYGLEKKYGLDERREFEQATAAAIKYLKFLYEEFGSWYLALGAYNCGEKCIADAMEEQKVGTYFRLNLPLETERFVYRIAAIKLILERPERYGYRIAASDIYPPLAADVRKVSLRNAIHFTDAAQALGTDYKMLKELNPHIIGSRLPAGEYILKVPAGKGAELSSTLEKLSAEAAKNAPSVESYYVVRRGDTLSKIAERKGVSVRSLKQLNRIRGDVIQVGQRLRLR